MSTLYHNPAPWGNPDFGTPHDTTTQELLDRVRAGPEASEGPVLPALPVPSRAEGSECEGSEAEGTSKRP
jgi:hypothetical protein